MLSLPATILWFVFLIVILWAFQRCTGWLTQLNIFTLFLGFLVLRHGITVPFDHTVNQWYAGISISDEGYTRFYTSLVLMWLSLLIGVVAGRIILGSAYVNPVAFRTTMSGCLPEGVSEIFLLVLAVSLGLIAVFQLTFSADLGKLLTGGLSSEEYRAMRDSYGIETHYSAGLGYRLASIVRFGLLPTLLCSLYFLAQRKIIWRILFTLTAALGLLVGLSSGQKGATVFLLVSLAIAYYYRIGRIKIKLLDWRIWAGLAAGVCMIALLYLLQYPQQSFGWALQATTYRLTSEADRSLQLYFEIYPDVQPFLHGKSSSLVNSLLGVDFPGDLLPERFIPTYYLGPEYLNTWNGAFIGVAWADFGYCGVVLESAFVGTLLYAYARWFSRVRKTALVMGTQVGLLMASTRLSEVALSASLLTFGLLSCFAVYWIMQSSRRRRHPIEFTTTNANPPSHS